MNKSKLNITFILPTFNEKKNINILLKELIGIINLYELELIVVDDNSQDGTPEIVREFTKNKKTSD